MYTHKKSISFIQIIIIIEVPTAFEDEESV